MFGKWSSNNIFYQLIERGSIHFLQVPQYRNTLLVVNNIHMHRQPTLVVNIGHFITTCYKKKWFIHYNFDGAHHDPMHNLNHSLANWITLMFSRANFPPSKIEKVIWTFQSLSLGNHVWTSVIMQQIAQFFFSSNFPPFCNWSTTLNYLIVP
jgi:hypothetical protein